MTAVRSPLGPLDPVYPSSDGKPMADNTLQYRWIVRIKEGLEVQFKDAADVFIAGDLLWYPVQGHPEICQAPDALAAIGRPKGERLSYKQWEEGNVAPQVVFEVLSPNNTRAEMARKLRFYERYGVEEYYVYDPDADELTGYLRQGGTLQAIPKMQDWISPRLKIRFDLSGKVLQIFHPDGQPFRIPTEWSDLWEEAEQGRQAAERARAKAEKAKAKAEKAKADAELARANAEKAKADAEKAKAKAEKGKAQAEKARADLEEKNRRLLERLRALGINPEEV